MELIGILLEDPGHEDLALRFQCRLIKTRQFVESSLKFQSRAKKVLCAVTFRTRRHDDDGAFYHITRSRFKSRRAVFDKLRKSFNTNRFTILVRHHHCPLASETSLCVSSSPRDQKHYSWWDESSNTDNPFNVSYQHHTPSVQTTGNDKTRSTNDGNVNSKTEPMLSLSFATDRQVPNAMLLLRSTMPIIAKTSSFTDPPITTATMLIMTITFGLIHQTCCFSTFERAGIVIYFVERSNKYPFLWTRF